MEHRQIVKLGEMFYDNESLRGKILILAYDQVEN